MPRFYKLNNGVNIPSVGLGTYRLEEPATVERVLHAAIDDGYRSIDCASYYGNQKAIGHAIASAPVGRAELFISSKVWTTDRGYDSTLRAFDNTAAELGLDYLDLYLIHWPATQAQTSDWRRINTDTWRAMERLADEGRVHAIGVCNFKPHHLEALLHDARIVPAINQIEFHPGNNQTSTSVFCQSHGIRIEAWSPLARGRIINNEVLHAIARSHGVTVAQVCLRWCLQKGVIPLPKSENPVRIKENIDIFGFELSDADMGAIDGLDGIDNSGLDPDTVKF